MSLLLLEELIETNNRAGLENLIHSNPDLLQMNTSSGVSPLLLACYYQKNSLIQVILKNMRELNLFEAAALGMDGEIKNTLVSKPELLDSFSNHGFTALGIATHFGKEEAVRLLLSLHANPNLPSQNGFQVYPLHAATLSNFTQVTKLLLEGGAEVNVYQNQRNTPLHFASMHGNIDLIINLLENGANVDVKNENGLTPADMAAEKGYIEIAKILKT